MDPIIGMMMLMASLVIGSGALDDKDPHNCRPNCVTYVDDNEIKVVEEVTYKPIHKTKKVKGIK